MCIGSCFQHCISLLKGCKSLKNLMQIQAYASKTGLHNHPFILGQLLLLSSVSIADAIEYSCRLFSYIPSPDAFMYNTLIRGLSDSPSPRHSLLLYAQMRRCSLPPDSFSFAFILKAAANSRSLHTGTQLHCQALALGLDTHLFVRTTLISMYAECGEIHHAHKAFDETPQPNIVTWNAIVTACFRCDDIEGAESLFDRMPWRNLTSWNLMLAGYMKAGKLEQARTTFKAMPPQKDPVSWSTMIVGFAHNGCSDEAFGFFRESHKMGTRPNEVSLTGVLSACAQTGALEFGKMLHCYIQKAGFDRIVSVSNALLDTYAKCGNIDMAHLVFNWMMEKKSIVSWTSMIAALAMHGHGEEAIQLFHEMERSAVRPDGITFISVLYACSHAGLIEQGSEHFSKMIEIYGIEPTLEHYGCMVDLYGRASLLDKAYELVMGMSIEPNAIIWRTLLGACSIHGNVLLAEQVKERLSELDPNNSGDQVLLSNIYAVAGEWSNVAAVRRSMTNQKIKKTPGWSTIEVDKVVYSFIAGDGPNGVTKEALEKLREIMLKLKLEGYVPEIGSVLHDIEEEEKEDAISRHSEKLAVAFGLTRLCEGSMIRIVKNLRVCKDCHIVMKLISKVYGREIVVRDRSRFHLFRQGSCSCKDYW